jgi:hypothetical protein
MSRIAEPPAEQEGRSWGCPYSIAREMPCYAAVELITFKRRSSGVPRNNDHVWGGNRKVDALAESTG